MLGPSLHGYPTQEHDGESRTVFPAAGVESPPPRRSARRSCSSSRCGQSHRSWTPCSKTNGPRSVAPRRSGVPAKPLARERASDILREHMSKRTTAFRCLLISPSDVDEERAAVADVIDRWNAQVGEGHDASVRLVMWETHAVPDVSAPAQEILNRDIVDECDFGIAVFWTRLGSPTTTHESGSIEEIERLRQRGARVLVYMSSAPIPQERLKDDQYHRLSEFKKRLRNEGLLGTYHDVADLREQILLHTTTVIIDLLQKDRGQPSPDAAMQIGVLTAPQPKRSSYCFCRRNDSANVGHTTPTWHPHSELFGSIRVSQRYFRVYPGFPTIFSGLLGFFVGDFMGKALWQLVENAQRFPRRGGRVLCVHGAVSFHGARPWATRWLPGRGARRDVELDRCVLGLRSGRCSHQNRRPVQAERSIYPGKTEISGTYALWETRI